MFLQHFGLKHVPFDKGCAPIIDSQQYKQLTRELDWLLQTKGLGLLTGEVGIGKTTALRSWVRSINAETHKVIYQSDNHFRAFDIYGQLAGALGVEQGHRYSRLWRDLKEELLALYQHKKVTPIWILDEAQALPGNFLTQLPSFLNFSFDSEEVMVVILSGTPDVQALLKRRTHAALHSRLHCQIEWSAIEDIAQFTKLVKQAFEEAGCVQTIMSETGFKFLHMVTKGRFRVINHVLTRSLQLACQKNDNHLSDDILKTAVEQLRICER